MISRSIRLSVRFHKNTRLVECPSLQNIRENYFIVSSVKELSDIDDSMSVIGSTITETNFIVSSHVCYLSFILA